MINCKVELKLRWTKHCNLASASAENNNADTNNINFTIEDTKLYVPVVTVSAKDNQKLSKLFLAKDLKDQFIGMNIKQKMSIKIRQTSIDVLSNQILLVLIDCLC